MANPANPRLTLHKAGHGYVGRLKVTSDFLQSNEVDDCKSTGASTSDRQTMFVLDRSGSMGQNVQRIANVVIPAVARRHFKLASNDQYTLITFDSSTETAVATVEEFERRTLHARGATKMAGVFDAILSCVTESAKPQVSIVAISDGQVWDTAETLQAAAAASSQLKNSFSVSATAIRLFTSSAQPDTRALASILQLNTVNAGSIIDIEAASTLEGLEDIIDTIGTAIGTAPAGPLFTLDASSPCFLQVPWAPASSTFHAQGLHAETPTSIWLASLPLDPTLNGVPVAVEMGEDLTHETLHILLEDKISYFLDQLRVLKIINSPSAKDELTHIVSYFKTLEDTLPPPSELSSLLGDRSLLGRTKYMKASLVRRLKSVTQTMQNIANDERVANLNLQQQADYLRQGGDSLSRNSRALARRAETSGIDFAATMRAEILTMAAHMQLLDSVDDSQHAVSFYSQATTLDGIHCMVELANEPDLLNNLTAADMLRLFNIVGIPAVGPVGDFPDPMTYRIENFLYGAYVSVADVTMALHQGGSLTVPGHKDPIVTAVPFFEDQRVQKFLQRYARSSLEYISSIGMRRMIAEVPKTYPYTVCSGIWKLVEELDKKGKSEIRVQHFKYLVHTYEEAVRGHFEHIVPLLKNNQDPTMSYNLGNNGITNMIAPILYKVHNGEPVFMSRILRALYSFETYQVMRRAMRNNGPNVREETLDKILGVDFSSNRTTSLPLLFTRNEPQHCGEALINAEALAKYTERLWFVSYATLLHPFFTALLHSEDPVRALQAILPMSTDSITEALGLPSSITLPQFLLYCVVEALLFGDKASRIDKESGKPKLADLGNPGAGEDLIRQYVTSRYAADYKKRLKVQLAKEEKILQDELIATMLSTASIQEFQNCIKSGNQRGCVAISIDRPNSAGFAKLHDCLMDEEQNIPKRAAKLFIIYSGRSLSGEKVFNGGNFHSCDWKPLQTLLVSRDKKFVWDHLQKELSLRGHLYRGGADCANRHGHSNELKSYFAYGFPTLQHYCDVASEENWSAYANAHQNCCGVADFLAQSRANQLSF